MFIDTSAFVAILVPEPDRDNFINAIDSAARKITSGLVKLETVMALSRFDFGSPSQNLEALQELIDGGGIKVVEIDDEISSHAIAAFARYGKGQGHPAQLNLADCMSYAVARHHRLPILCKGGDFAMTDIEVVEASSQAQG